MRREGAIQLTTSQMLSLFLSRRVFDFLEGTGFKEDLDEVFTKLETTLKHQDALLADNLDRKIFDVNEAPHLYQGRIEDVNDVLTALVREDRLQVLHVSSTIATPASASTKPPGKRITIDPYTLLVYKKGLYLVGYSHHHQEIRTFALDGFHEVEWLRGDHFEYPDDYHPSQIVEGAFGLISGAPRKVRIRFSRSIAWYIERTRWHPSQRIRQLTAGAGGIELTMEVALTVDLKSWILGFGKDAEVLEPDELRKSVAEEIREMAGMYRLSV